MSVAAGNVASVGSAAIAVPNKPVTSTIIEITVKLSAITVEIKNTLRDKLNMEFAGLGADEIKRFVYCGDIVDVQIPICRYN
jgi:hypothetical protein